MSFQHPHDSDHGRPDSLPGKRSEWADEDSPDRYVAELENRDELNRMRVEILEKIRRNADKILDAKDINFSGWTKRSARIVTDFDQFQLQYSSPHAHFAEFGMPPWEAGNIDFHALRNWVEGKLGVPRESSAEVTYAVKKKIENEGYRGYRFLRKAIKLTVGEIGISRLDREPSPPKQELILSKWEKRLVRAEKLMKKMAKAMQKINAGLNAVLSFTRNPGAAVADGGMAIYKMGRKMSGKKSTARTTPRRARGRKLPMYDPSLKNFRYEGRRRKRYRPDPFIKTRRGQWKVWSHRYRPLLDEPIWEKTYGKGFWRLHETPTPTIFRRDPANIVYQVGKSKRNPDLRYKHPAAFMGGPPRKRRTRPKRKTFGQGTSPTARLGPSRARPTGATPYPVKSTAVPNTGRYGSSSRKEIRTPLSLLRVRKSAKKPRYTKNTKRIAPGMRALARGGGRPAPKLSREQKKKMKEFGRIMKERAHQAEVGKAVAKVFAKPAAKAPIDKSLIKRPNKASTMKLKPHKKSYIKRHKKK